jgi:GNAT superfamily N-acetyltransferase
LSKSGNSIGFYPDNIKLPQKIGCLNNLYIKEEYRGLKIGNQLFAKAMEWFRGFKDVRLLFVYISNGNDAALDFYLKRGFTYSHDVFGRFIKAAYMSL